VPRRIFKEGRGSGLGIFRSLSQKITQWESYSDKSNPITSRTGLHFRESSIAAKAKISQLMKRIELLEVRE